MNSQSLWTYLKGAMTIWKTKLYWFSPWFSIWVQYILTCNMDKHEKKKSIDLKTFQGKGLEILFGEF